jgi:hypothetical protein
MPANKGRGLKELIDVDASFQLRRVMKGYFSDKSLSSATRKMQSSQLHYQLIKIGRKQT